MNNEEKKKDLNPPVTGKEPLTEAERIKRKKMIRPRDVADIRTVE